MPRLIISFDMNTEGPESGRARRIFGNKLGQFGWTNEVLVDGIWETLPNTTLVSDRSDVDAKADVAAAEAAAKRIEPEFVLEKFIVSGYRRVDSRSDDTREETTGRKAVHDFLRKVRESRT